ncbi:MAG: O-antigen ligase family protein [Leptospiraceae bacterium]|nr:O-antigen ligase family protein [Leptospiraceae bacterium]
MQSFSIKQSGWIHRGSFIGGAIMIVGSAISISLVSAGAAVAVLFWIAEAYQNRNSGGVRWKMPLPFYLGFALFGWLALSLAVRSILAWFGLWPIDGVPSDGFDAFLWHLRKGWNTELKDVLLILTGLWTYTHSRDALSRRWLLRCFYWAGVTILVTGFISIFTLHRLAKIPYHLLHGWQATAAARFQHHVGTLFASTSDPIHLYMPIGLQNTHMTYAALAGLFTLFLVFSLASRYVRRPLRSFLDRRFLLLALALVAMGIVLILNNGRSALLAIALSAVVGLYWFIRNRWKSKARALWFPIGALIAVLVLSAVALTIADSSAGRMRETAESLTGEEKHTDYQRLLVWNAAHKMMFAHPLFGVGPGAFSASVERDIIETGESKPFLFYPYALIQRGHSHNDLFNFAAIGGLPAAAIFLAFWASVLLEVLDAGGRGRLWKFGLLIVFFGGWFQCFFLDDEVIIPFWCLLGLVIPGKKRMTPEAQLMKTESKGNPE